VKASDRQRRDTLDEQDEPDDKKKAADRIKKSAHDELGSGEVDLGGTGGVAHYASEAPPHDRVGRYPGHAEFTHKWPKGVKETLTLDEEENAAAELGRWNELAGLDEANVEEGLGDYLQQKLGGWKAGKATGAPKSPGGPAPRREKNPEPEIDWSKKTLYAQPPTGVPADQEVVPGPDGTYGVVDRPGPWDQDGGEDVIPPSLARPKKVMSPEARAYRDAWESGDLQRGKGSFAGGMAAMGGTGTAKRKEVRESITLDEARDLARRIFEKLTKETR